MINHWKEYLIYLKEISPDLEPFLNLLYDKEISSKNIMDFTSIHIYNSNHTAVNTITIVFDINTIPYKQWVRDYKLNILTNSPDLK